MTDWTSLARDLLRNQNAPVPDERRMFERVDIPERPKARIVTDRTGERAVGIIKDLSVTGVGFISGVALIPGQFIVIDLEWNGRAQLFLARVAHCKQVDVGMHRVGAEFFDERPIAGPDSPVPADWLAKLPPH